MKPISVFVCQKCGAQSPKWVGRCPECGAWGTLQEELKNPKTQKLKAKAGKKAAKLLKVGEITTDRTRRIRTGIGELDQVLGGGIIPGAVVLFAGEPGIGKSTLLTQLALKLTAGQNLKPRTTVYVCGEESPEQIKLRIARLSGEKKMGGSNLLFLPETDVDLIIDATNRNLEPCPLVPQAASPCLAGGRARSGRRAKTRNLLIIDSIQTLFTTDLSGIAGSVSQVRECTQRLIELAKTRQIPVLLVGHVTKKGILAGPKTIEHAVDTVLYFEGERSADLRLLRSVKNRFGPTDEVGIFQMTDTGLKEVLDPASLLKPETRNQKPKPGSAAAVVFEGTRPMLVEVQALVTKTFTPMPKRVVNGLDRNRSEMLIAILQKHLHIPLWQYDVFLNIAGGFKVKEPAADLAVCAAIYSSYKNKSLLAKSVFIGEVSLLGEINMVSRMKKREKQARALGFKQVITASQVKSLSKIREWIMSDE